MVENVGQREAFYVAVCYLRSIIVNELRKTTVGNSKAVTACHIHKLSILSLK